MTNELAISLLFAGASFLFAYIGANLDDEHIVIKLFFKMISLFILLIGFNAIGTAVNIAKVSNIIYVGYWAVGILIFLTMLYWVAYLLIKMLYGLNIKKKTKYETEFD